MNDEREIIITAEEKDAACRQIAIDLADWNRRNPLEAVKAQATTAPPRQGAA